MALRGHPDTGQGTVVADNGRRGGNKLVLGRILVADVEEDADVMIMMQLRHAL
jgi:hypothetical protein